MTEMMPLSWCCRSAVCPSFSLYLTRKRSETRRSPGSCLPRHPSASPTSHCFTRSNRSLIMASSRSRLHVVSVSACWSKLGEVLGAHRAELRQRLGEEGKQPAGQRRLQKLHSTRQLFHRQVDPREILVSHTVHASAGSCRQQAAGSAGAGLRAQQAAVHSNASNTWFLCQAPPMTHSSRSSASATMASHSAAVNRGPSELLSSGTGAASESAGVRSRGAG